MTRIAILVSWMLGGCVTSELLGYFLHRLLHSGAFPFLSRGHMRHHMLLYGPRQEQQSGKYCDATTDRIGLGNIGAEWLLPAGVLLACLTMVLSFAGTRPLYVLLFLSGTLGWSFLMFSYLHDVMHIEGAWLETNQFLRTWFVSARRRHNIHHCTINADGLMDKNFGIGLFVFDRLFGTFADRGAAFNHAGYRAARQRFRSLLNVRDKEETFTVQNGEIR